MGKYWTNSSALIFQQEIRTSTCFKKCTVCEENKRNKVFRAYLHFSITRLL